MDYEDYQELEPVTKRASLTMITTESRFIKIFAQMCYNISTRRSILHIFEEMGGDERLVGPVHICIVL